MSGVFERQVAVVTGGGRGIGAAICRALAAEGARVAVADVDADEAFSTAVGIDGLSYEANVAEESEVTALIDAVERDLGPIDIFVSNAGVGFGDAESGAASRAGGMVPCEDRWAACWNVNVMAHVYAARAMVPRMIERGGGVLVNVASAAGLLAQIGDAAYTATKHAAVGFAESLAITHGDDGIRVSVLCPQAVATRMIGFDEAAGEAQDMGFAGNDVDGVLSTDEVASHVLEAIREERFMILPHPQVATYFQRKAADHDRWIGGMRRFRRELIASDAMNKP
jgi:NAD(P)-dependent dehydrogenase (short-subunit alcohol dehydrogenase family)